MKDKDSEFRYIRATSWYSDVLKKLDERKTYELHKICNCRDIQALGEIQGSLRALDFIINLLTEE